MRKQSFWVSSVLHSFSFMNLTIAKKVYERKRGGKKVWKKENQTPDHQTVFSRKEEIRQGFVKIRRVGSFPLFCFIHPELCFNTLTYSGFPSANSDLELSWEMRRKPGRVTCSYEPFGTGRAPKGADFSINKGFWVAFWVSVRRSCCSNSVLYCLCFGPTPKFNNLVRKKCYNL